MAESTAIKTTKEIPRGRLTPGEVRSAIHDMCLKHDYNPFERLIELANTFREVKIDGKTEKIPLCDVDQQITIAKELAPYLAPKLKTIEVEAGGGVPGTGPQIQSISFADTVETAEEKMITDKTKHLMPSGVES